MNVNCPLLPMSSSMVALLRKVYNKDAGGTIMYGHTKAVIINKRIKIFPGSVIFKIKGPQQNG